MKISEVKVKLKVCIHDFKIVLLCLANGNTILSHWIRLSKLPKTFLTGIHIWSHVHAHTHAVYTAHCFWIAIKKILTNRIIILFLKVTISVFFCEFTIVLMHCVTPVRHTSVFGAALSNCWFNYIPSPSVCHTQRQIRQYRQDSVEIVARH